MSHIWLSHVKHVWLSYVTHTNDPWHAYERVMSHIWLSYVTHIWLSYVTHTNDPCHAYECQRIRYSDVPSSSFSYIEMSHVRTSHVTYMTKLLDTYKRSMSRIWMQVNAPFELPFIFTQFRWNVIQMDEYCHKYERDMSHMWTRHITQKKMSRATYMEQSCCAYKWVLSKSCHKYERDMSHMWTRHVTQKEGVEPHIWSSHVAHINESMSHICTRCGTYMNATRRATCME